MLSEQQGRILIRLARQTIEKHLKMESAEPVGPEELADPDLQARRGVFVTLKKRGQLRGCIGSLTGTETIIDGVRRHAVNAAFNDYRFSPVTAAELPELNIEVSVLTEPRPLAYQDADDLVRQLRPQVDGVILQDAAGRSATFLPQVWEQLPSAPLFLGQLCLKAGLPDNAWKTGNLQIQTYQVQYFEEGR